VEDNRPVAKHHPKPAKFSSCVSVWGKQSHNWSWYQNASAQWRAN